MIEGTKVHTESSDKATEGGSVNTKSSDKWTGLSVLKPIPSHRTRWFRATF